MKKILLPIDGTIRSLRSLQFIQKTVSPEEASITIFKVLNSKQSIGQMAAVEQEKELTEQALIQAAAQLPGYHVETATAIGDPSTEILHFAREGKFDSIVMTRSSCGPLWRLGSVTTHVMRYADFLDLTVLKEVPID